MRATNNMWTCGNCGHQFHENEYIWVSIQSVNPDGTQDGDPGCPKCKSIDIDLESLTPEDIV